MKLRIALDTRQQIMSDRNYRETTERKDIRNWADQRGVIPVRRTDTGDLAFVREEELESDDSSRELTWHEFNNEFDRRGTTFRYEDEEPTEDEIGHYEFVEEEGATDRDADRLDKEDVIEEGDVLEEGESAHAEVTETRTIEKEVVETATVETEVVDEEIVSEEVVDTELLEREVSRCSIDEHGEYIEADLRERKRFTTEIRERDIIESRVVDVEAEETPTADTDTDSVDRDVDIEGEHELVDEESVEREVEETEVREREETDVKADIIDSETEHGERIERRLVETDVVEQYHVRAAIEEVALFDEEVVSEEVTDTELLDGEGVTTETDTTAEGAAAGGDDFTRSASESETARQDEDAEILDDDPESAREGTTDTTSETVQVDDSHEGNEVVDADGETVGIITGVEDDTIYVDPNPDLTDRLKADLGWGGGDESDRTIQQNQVEDVQGNAIRVSGSGREELEGSDTR